MKVTKSSLQALVILGVAASSNAANLRGGGDGEPGALVIGDGSPGGKIPPQPWASSGRDNIAYAEQGYLRGDGAPGIATPRSQVATYNKKATLSSREIQTGPEGQGRGIVGRDNIAYHMLKAGGRGGDSPGIQVLGDKSQAHPDAMVIGGKSAPAGGNWTTRQPEKAPKGAMIKRDVKRSPNGEIDYYGRYYEYGEAVAAAAPAPVACPEGQCLNVNLSICEPCSSSATMDGMETLLLS